MRTSMILALLAALLATGTVRADEITNFPAATGPWEVEALSDGSVVVAVFHDDEVRRIHADGTVQILLSGLDGPKAVCVAPSGNIYAAGFWSDRCWRIEPDGSTTQVFNGSGLDRAYGVAVDDAETVFLVGLVSDNCLAIESDGTITEIIDGSGDGAGNPFKDPANVAVGPGGEVYVVGNGSDNVFRIDPDGSITEIVDAAGAGPGAGLNGPIGLAVDAAGNVFVGGEHSDNVLRVTPGGVISEVLDASGDGTHGLDRPSQIALGDDGTLYVAGVNSDNAFSVAPDGTVTQLLDASGDGQGNELNEPLGICVLDEPWTVWASGYFSENVLRLLGTPTIPNPFAFGTHLDGGTFTVELLAPPPGETSGPPWIYSASIEPTWDGHAQATVTPVPLFSGNTVTLLVQGETYLEDWEVINRVGVLDHVEIDLAGTDSVFDDGSSPSTSSSWTGRPYQNKGSLPFVLDPSSGHVFLDPPAYSAGDLYTRFRLDYQPGAMSTVPGVPVRHEFLLDSDVLHGELHPLVEPWWDAGHRLAGLDGIEPGFVGFGPFEDNSVNRFIAGNCRPGETLFLVYGWMPLYAPFRGGVMVPAPDSIYQLTGSAEGSVILELDGVDVPEGVSLYFQYWLQDADAVKGYAATNGLVITGPTGG